MRSFARLCYDWLPDREFGIHRPMERPTTTFRRSLKKAREVGYSHREPPLNPPRGLDMQQRRGRRRWRTSSEAWPEEYGGQGRSIMEQVIYREFGELVREFIDHNLKLLEVVWRSG